MKIGVMIPTACVLWSQFATASSVDLMSQFVSRDGYHSGNKELQFYDRSLVVQKDHSIILNLKKEFTSNCSEKDPGFSCEYRSGWIDTYGSWSTATHTRGMIVVEASVNPRSGVNAAGLWPAIWMLPNSLPPLSMEKNAQYPWPLNGEIDILEGRGSNPSEMASTIHYGSDSATRHAYNGSILNSPQLDTARRVQYAFSWDFTKQGNDPEMFYWKVKLSPNDPWKEVKRIDLTHLIEDGKNMETCPSLGLNYPEKRNIPMKNCFLNVFQAGQESGYYLIVNLAVGGYYDGNPDVRADLSGSSMTVFQAQYYSDVINPEQISSN